MKSIEQSAKRAVQKPIDAEKQSDRRKVWQAMQEHLPELADQMPDISRLGIASIAIYDDENNLITAWRK